MARAASMVAQPMLLQLNMASTYLDLDNTQVHGAKGRQNKCNRLQLGFSFRSSAAAPPTWPHSRLAKDF
jgi:hypothetical protein